MAICLSLVDTASDRRPPARACRRKQREDCKSKWFRDHGATSKEPTPHCYELSNKLEHLFWCCAKKLQVTIFESTWKLHVAHRKAFLYTLKVKTIWSLCIYLSVRTWGVVSSYKKLPVPATHFNILFAFSLQQLKPQRRKYLFWCGLLVRWLTSGALPPHAPTTSKYIHQKMKSVATSSSKFLGQFP